MKLNSKILLLAAAISLPSAPVSAFLGVGDVVTDPGSYGHYIKQFEQSVKQAKIALDNLKVAGETLDKVDELSGIVGKYQQALQRPYSMLKHVGLDFDDILYDIDRGMAGALGDDARVVVKEILDIDTNMDGLTVGLMDEKPWMTGYKTRFDMQEQYRKTMRQMRIKQGQVDQRKKELDKLAEEVGNTANMKESAALRNRLLVNINEGQQEVIKLLASAQEAEALSKYTGYSEEQRRKFEAAAKARAVNPDASWENTNTQADRLRARGIIPWNDRTPWQKKCLMPGGRVNSFITECVK